MAKKQFKTESKRILDMMINSVYTNKEIFLRELISNASDAIDKLSYRSLTDDSVTLTREDYKIIIAADKDNRTITVSDNGIGMTAKELEENLGVIAKSGSLAFKKEHGETEESPDIIGQFGVGFYSAFMISSKVTVLSKAYGEDTANIWTSSGVDGYTIEPAEKDQAGTVITLYVKEDEEGEEYSRFLDENYLSSLVKKYSDYIRWPVIIGGNTINSMVPIWQRSKSEVSDEDCAAYYKETFYDDKDPAGIIRINAEGTVSFKALIFIPRSIPFDYYSASFTPGLRLYSNGVMIMEKCSDLLPDYFRFARGVVDSPDLSLNISREILQQDRQLKIIASNIEKRIKSELKKIMDKSRDIYEEFYKNFGLQLKYGIIADFGAKKDFLKDLLMYYSEKQQKMVSIDEYIEKMPQCQKYIYFAPGENIKMSLGMPQTEPVREAGFDILSMTDSVDEFVTGILEEYGDKKFKSVNDDDLGLDTEENKEEKEKIQEENKDLLDFVKESLDGRAAAVKISNKLKSYPSCLSTQGPITLEMEKYFASLPTQGEKITAERVLELNPDHDIFTVLKDAFENDKEKAADIAKLLYSQAEIMAGYLPEDPSAFALLMSKYIK